MYLQSSPSKGTSGEIWVKYIRTKINNSRLIMNTDFFLIILLLPLHYGINHLKYFILRIRNVITPLNKYTKIGSITILISSGNVVK